MRGAVETHTPVTYLHVTLPPGTHFDAAGAGVAERDGLRDQRVDGEGELVVFAHDGDVVEVANADATRAARAARARR